MDRTVRLLGITTAGAALLVTGAPASAHHSPLNRTVDTVHQPVVQRTDYVLDLAAGPYGLSHGEADRLDGWFDGLRLGYGDSVTIDDPAGRAGQATREQVGAVISQYGLLLSHAAAPVTVGAPPPGTVRVIVSRATAHVDGCPDWSVGNLGEYNGASMSNYGCATAINTAAMIANPEDLIEGRDSGPADDANLSVKAIKTYRDADPTGKGGLKDTESVKTVSSGGGN